MRSSRRPIHVVAAAALAVGLLAASCGSSSSSSSSSSTSSSSPEAGSTDTVAPDAPGALRLVTHDSFAVSDSVLEAFEARTGIKVEIVQDGDAVEMVNKAILTKDDPQADVLFGIDSNTLTKAYDADLFEPYIAKGLDAIDPSYVLDPVHRVTPIDHGDVCLNYDKAWFAGKGLAVPTSMDDLRSKAYEGALVTENPATSTPGLAFLLATVAKYGDDGWQGYWKDLRANEVSVVDGWEAAYYTSFSGSSGKGDKPIVVSYATSPPAEVLEADPLPAEAPTGVIEDSCFRQIEFAGVLTGTKRPEAARQFIDFLLSDAFQDDVTNMYVLPVSSTATVPDTFAKYSADPADPLSLPSDEIGANSSDWVDAWTRTVLG